MPTQGEGSRGGKIVGHYKSGKPKYLSRGQMYSLGKIAVGAVTSIVGSKVVGKALKPFGTRARILGSLGTIGIGEMVVSDGGDTFIESLPMSPETQQAFKNVAAGALGVIGASSAIRWSTFSKVRKK